jgi:hypothetical protein
LIHPVLKLIATEPQLVGDHVEAYAELVGEEISKVSSGWIRRIALWAVAGLLAAIGLVLLGVALIVWAATPDGDLRSVWLLVAVPVVPLVGAGICAMSARAHTIGNAFDTVKAQLNADMAMLREVSSS